MAKNIVIILAGGVGSRTGLDRPKQFVEVLGRPILAYTCDIFQKNQEIDAIEIVCHRDWIDYCKNMVKENDISKVKWIVEGGETFQYSVMNGIKHLEMMVNDGEISLNDNIYIQYGGAPFTSQKIVSAVIEMTKEKGSAVTATPCYQLLGSRDSEDTSQKFVDRDKYIQIACPQGFRFEYILDIYQRAEDKGIVNKTEPHTTSLMYALGDNVNYAYGDQTNIKITTKEDIKLFKGYALMKKLSDKGEFKCQQKN